MVSGGGTTPGPAPTAPPGQVTVGGTTITNVDVYTDNGQKWYLTDASRWVSAKYVKTSSEVRYCSNL